MEDRRGGRNGRMSVPQFGSWENQGGGGGGGGGGPDPADGYTMVFTKARADRKEQKAKTVPAHLAMNPDENDALHPSSKAHYDHHGRRRGHHQHHRNHHRRGQEPPRHSHSHQLSHDEAAGKKNILTYLNCCIRP